MSEATVFSYRRGLRHCSFTIVGNARASVGGRVTVKTLTPFFFNPLDCESSNKQIFHNPTMKKLICGVIAFTMFFGATSVFADSVKDQIKERKELAKQSKKELEQKATKSARNEAKTLKKQGWLIAPGALPLERQLDKSYMMQYQYDVNGFPQYIMAEAMSTGGNYDAAKMQALELAKQNLAGQIQTEVTALIENTVANEQMDQSQAESITRSVMASKNLISQSIGRVVPVIEAYRVVNGNGREVLVRIAYSQDAAKRAAKKAIKEELEKKGDELHGKLDELLGW